MEISKEQVLKLYDKSFHVDQKLKEWFPEAFKVELEVGKWYCHDKSKSIVNYQGGSTGYGFSALKNWSPLNYNISWSFKTLTHEWRLATTEEWESALIKEARKRGYVGNYIKMIAGSIDQFSAYEMNDLNYCDGKIMGLSIKSDYTLFKDGVWAEIIKTFSKEEAEELLGGKII